MSFRSFIQERHNSHFMPQISLFSNDWTSQFQFIFRDKQFILQVMGIFIKFFFALFTCFQVNNSVNAGERFQVAYQWKSLSFNDLPENAVYNVTHPVPFGIARHKNRMFICTARRNYGIPVTIGYFNLYDLTQQPEIIPYPTYDMNTLHVSHFWNFKNW